MNRFTPFRRLDATKRRPTSVRLELEFLEARYLLNGTPTNVLVNNPAEDTIPMQDTQSETAIVLGANSKVVVAYNDDGTTSFPTPANPTAPLNPTVAGYSLSTNGGTSFADEGQLPHSSPYFAGMDPTLARSNLTGTVLLSITSNDTNIQTQGGRVLIYRSTDNGQTFSLPIDGSPGFVEGLDMADKPWIAVDNYPGYGNAYLVWTDFNFKNNGGITDKGIYFTRTTDDGLTWGPSGGMPIDVKSGANAVQGGFVTVGPDHTVYVFWWNYNTSENILMSKSTDLGQTFTNPVIVTRLNTNSSGNNNGDLGLTYSNTNSRTFRTNAYPQATVNPVTGDIYVVYNDAPKGGTKDKADIFFTMSSDGGNTWSSPLRVNDDTTTTDQWQPAMALTPDGTHLFVTWYDRRNDPTNDSLIDRYGVIGTVSGHSANFAPNFLLTDVSFPPEFGQDPIVPATYMGDYDMATADNNYFYTTWGDNRLGDQWFANQPDVRFAKIPVSWAATASSLAAPALTSAAAAVSAPGALLPTEAAWTGLAVDAVFTDPARASQTASSAVNGGTAPSNNVGLALPSPPGTTDPAVSPPARVSGTRSAAPPWWAAHRPADGGGMDVPTLADASWDGDPATSPAG